MAMKKLVEGGIFILKSEADVTDYVTNLDAVTSATDGTKINVKGFGTVDVNVNISGNTGAVTVNIETSPTGAFTGEEQNLDSITRTTNVNDIFSYKIASNFLRTTTTTQSNSTVSTLVTARS